MIRFVILYCIIHLLNGLFMRVYNGTICIRGHKPSPLTMRIAVVYCVLGRWFSAWSRQHITRSSILGRIYCAQYLFMAQCNSVAMAFILLRH